MWKVLRYELRMLVSSWALRFFWWSLPKEEVSGRVIVAANALVNELVIEAMAAHDAFGILARRRSRQ